MSIDDILTRSLAHPPVVEAVAGLEFRPRGLDVVSLVRESDKWGSAYPLVTAQGALPPTRPVGQPGSGFEMQFGEGSMPVRVWATSADQGWLVQSQDDRLLLNWRRVVEGQGYPGYFEEIRPKFEGLLDLISEDEEPEIVPLVAEFSYVNQIATDEAGLHSVYAIFRAPDRAMPGRVVGQRYEIVSEFDHELGIGQLTVSIQPAGYPGTTTLTVSAKVFAGRHLTPAEGMKLVDRAHDASKEGFFAIVSDTATSQWGVPGES